MAASLADLMSRARSFLRDSGGGFIEDTDLVAWVNEAQTDIAARTQVLQHEVEGTATGDIAFPTGVDPDLVEILDLAFGDDRVQFIDSVLWDALTDSDATPSRTVARVFDDVIELYPAPDADAYTLRYSKIPTPLVSGSDLHELPLQMERKLVEYAVAQGKYKDGATDEGDRWLARYEQGLPGVSTGRERYFTQQLRITREPSIWDVTGSHI